MKALSVIPAKAGIQSFQLLWTPAFAGLTVWTNEIFLKLTALGRPLKKTLASVQRSGTIKAYSVLINLLDWHGLDTRQ